MNPPITLTDEEIDELNRIYKITSNRDSRWSSSSYGYNYDYWGGNSSSSSSNQKRRHEWVPILLLIGTVYNCKHCDAKQEKTTGDYCEEEF